jgi:hypothetical protein
VEEAWLEVVEFPGYSVSNWGRVRNDFTGRVLTLLRNQHGVSHVGMNRCGVQYKRGVARLVADRFLPKNTLDPFDTPMHLDGDVTNNEASNLIWRPRWFVLKYERQFHRRPLIPVPIREVDSRERFNDSRDAATTYGLLEVDIVNSVTRGDPVFPTFQRYELVDLTR